MDDRQMIDCNKIIECLEEEIFVTDEKGYILFLNPEAEKVCGVKFEDVAGKHVTDWREGGKNATPGPMKKIIKAMQNFMVQKLRFSFSLFYVCSALSSSHWRLTVKRTDLTSRQKENNRCCRLFFPYKG